MRVERVPIHSLHADGSPAPSVFFQCHWPQVCVSQLVAVACLSPARGHLCRQECVEVIGSLTDKPPIGPVHYGAEEVGETPNFPRHEVTFQEPRFEVRLQMVGEPSFK